MEQTLEIQHDWTNDPRPHSLHPASWNFVLWSVKRRMQSRCLE